MEEVRTSLDIVNGIGRGSDADVFAIPFCNPGIPSVIRPTSPSLLTPPDPNLSLLILPRDDAE